MSRYQKLLAGDVEDGLTMASWLLNPVSSQLSLASLGDGAFIDSDFAGEQPARTGCGSEPCLTAPVRGSAVLVAGNTHVFPNLTGRCRLTAGQGEISCRADHKDRDK